MEIFIADLTFKFELVIKYSIIKFKDIKMIIIYHLNY